jgi:hypothetical protein
MYEDRTNRWATMHVFILNREFELRLNHFGTVLMPAAGGWYCTWKSL